MTRAAKLKKAIRERARKTGESYSAARRQLLKKRAPDVPAAAPPTAQEPAAPRGATGAVSDAACRERTGFGLDHWFAVLDALNTDIGHTAAARHLREQHGVGAWYSQGITVAWERARGLRQVNQRATGTWEVSVSRVLPRECAVVVAVLRAAEPRQGWLTGAPADLARALRAGLSAKGSRGLVEKPTGAVLGYRQGASRVEWRLTARGQKAVVSVSHMRIATRAEMEERRGQWRALLDALRAALA